MLHVVLVEPEIPPNTGNIARLCLAAGAASISSSRWGFRSRKRRCAARAWITGTSVMCAHGRRLKLWPESGDARFLFFTTKTKRLYWDEQFQRGDHLVFGRETKGLPEPLLTANAKFCLTIPMRQEARSLNSATAAGIVLYEAIRQLRSL